MEWLATILVLYVALFHVQVFIIEVFLWKTPRARKAFGTTVATAEITYPLAINQGVYNLFLSAGLVLSFVLDDPFRFQAQMFFAVLRHRGGANSWVCSKQEDYVVARSACPSSYFSDSRNLLVSGYLCYSR